MTIEEFAKEQGIELLPWQREAAKIIEQGGSAVFVGGRRAGRTTFKRLVQYTDESLAQIKHALEVFTKLVNVYGGE